MAVRVGWRGIGAGEIRAGWAGKRVGLKGKGGKRRREYWRLNLLLLLFFFDIICNSVTDLYTFFLCIGYSLFITVVIKYLMFK